MPEILNMLQRLLLPKHPRNGLRFHTVIQDLVNRKLSLQGNVRILTAKEFTPHAHELRLHL